MFEMEELSPRAHVVRHARLLAAAANGPLKRRDRKPWAASDFLGADAWAPPQAKKPPPTAAQLRAQVTALNARRRKH